MTRAPRAKIRHFNSPFVVNKHTPDIVKVRHFVTQRKLGDDTCQGHY